MLDRHPHHHFSLGRVNQDQALVQPLLTVLLLQILSAQPLVHTAVLQLPRMLTRAMEGRVPVREAPLTAADETI